MLTEENYYRPELLKFVASYEHQEEINKNELSLFCALVYIDEQCGKWEGNWVRVPIESVIAKSKLKRRQIFRSLEILQSFNWIETKEISGKVICFRIK